MPRFPDTALGLLETRGLIAAIEAADAMLKTSDVELQSIEQTVAALITIHIRGEVAAVKSAIDAGAAAAQRVGELVSAHVIARPADEVEFFLEIDESPAPKAVSSIPPKSLSAAEREALTVKELRKYARSIDSFPIQGRAIARANKAELLAHFKSMDDGS